MVSRYTHQGYGEMFEHYDGDPVQPGDKVYYTEDDYKTLEESLEWALLEVFDLAGGDPYILVRIPDRLRTVMEAAAKKAIERRTSQSDAAAVTPRTSP